MGTSRPSRIQLRPSSAPTSTASMLLPRSPDGIVIRRIGASSSLMPSSVTARAQTATAEAASRELTSTSPS